MAYNMLKERKLLNEGMMVGLKVQFMKSLLKKGNDLLYQAMRQFKLFVNSEKIDEMRNKEIKLKYIGCILDKNI